MAVVKRRRRPRRRERRCAATNEPAATPARGAASVKQGATVLGEHLTTRVISDPQQGGMPVGVVAVPDSWSFDAQITWNYANYSNPVTASSRRAESEERGSCDRLPGGAILRPAPPVSWHLSVRTERGRLRVRRTAVACGDPRRVRAAGSRAPARLPVRREQGSADLPGRCACLPRPPSAGSGSRSPTISTGVPWKKSSTPCTTPRKSRIDGPQGRTYQINWGLVSIHSFRAPKGTLDTRRPVFAAISKSFRPNPAWQQRLAAINAYLQDQFNRQLQAGYDQIAAAARLSQQISANNDAMIAAIDRQLAASSGTHRGRRRAQQRREVRRLHPRCRDGGRSVLRHVAAIRRLSVSLDRRLRRLPQHQRSAGPARGRPRAATGR